MEHKTDAQAIIDEMRDTARVGEIFEINGIPCTLIKQGYQIHSMEHLLDRPRRIKATVNLTTAASFIDYVNQYANDYSVIYADRVRALFTAIIDHHTPNEPNNSDHRAIYECPQTREWNAWMRSNERNFTQTEFAEFIEDHEADIIEPDGATMLEIARTLQSKTKVEFAQAVRLDNGQTRFSYNETLDSRAGEKGQLDIPQEITIAVEVFEKGNRYSVTAKFRYRIKDGALTLSYKLMNAAKVLDHAVDELIENINNETGSINLYEAARD